MSYNKIIVVGNVGSDPRSNFTADGTPVTSFSLAVNHRRPAREGREATEETEWFRVNCWRRLAESAGEYATKGRKVLAEGRLRSRSYTANDGTERHSNEIEADRVVYFGAAGERNDTPPAPDVAQDTVEDLPF